MRILQVIPHLAKGGAEKVVVELANELNSQGHQVELLLVHKVDFDLNQNNLNPEIQISFLLESFQGRYKTYAVLVKFLRKNLFDLKKFETLHFHLTLGFIAGIILRVIGFSRRIELPNLIFTDHSIGVKNSLWKRYLFRFSPRIFDQVILVAKDEYWESILFRGKQTNVRFIPNGINTQRINNLKQIRHECEPCTIATISRLVPERNPKLFIDLLAELKSESPNTIRFKLGGDGPQKNHLMKLVRESELSDEVEFTGFVTNADSFLTSVCLYVSLCVRDVTGIAGLEAILGGVPVVGIQLDRNYSLGSMDWIYSSSDLKSLSSRIVSLLDSQNALVGVLEAQSDYISNNLSIDRMASSYLNVYNSRKQ
jgi:glycosyltransferase involved in cell wall biosynthesis